MQSNRNNNRIVHKNAKKIAAKGKPVFPCAASKRPYTSNGFHDATVDPAKVSMFWNRHRGANIGVPTGKRSGFFAVDVDRLPALGELPE